MLGSCASRLVAFLEELWDHQKSESFLGMQLRGSLAEPALVDLVLFGASIYGGAGRVKDRSRKKGCASGRDYMVRTTIAILRCVAPLFENYIRHVHCSEHNALLPPPIIRYLSHDGSPSTKACKVDSQASWEILERARPGGLHAWVKPGVVLMCRDDLPATNGLSPMNGSHWLSQENAMYTLKNNVLMQHIQQINATADPSCHAGEETMVAVIYSWELNQGCLSLLAMPCSVHLSPEEVAMMPDIAFRAYARKLERKAAYRQLQCLLACACEYTGAQVSTFRVPEGVTLRAVREGEEHKLDVDPLTGRLTPYL